MGGSAISSAVSSVDSADWIPATMLDAPKRMKQPAITVRPYRKFTRPLSIMKPTDATATIAMVSAIVPSSVCSSHCTAAASGLAPRGSDNEAEMDAIMRFAME